MAQLDSSTQMGASARHFTFDLGDNAFNVYWVEDDNDPQQPVALRILHAPVHVEDTIVPNGAIYVGSKGDCYCFRV